MKQIKAFIHRNRIADVLHSLRNNDFCAGHCNISINNVAGTLQAMDHKEKDFSIEFGEGVITEVKLELICEDDRVDQAISLITDSAKTGQSLAGWIYIIDIARAVPIKS